MLNHLEYSFGNLSVGPTMCIEASLLDTVSQLSFCIVMNRYRSIHVHTDWFTVRLRRLWLLRCALFCFVAVFFFFTIKFGREVWLWSQEVVKKLFFGREVEEFSLAQSYFGWEVWPRGLAAKFDFWDPLMYHPPLFCFPKFWADFCQLNYSTRIFWNSDVPDVQDTYFCCCCCRPRSCRCSCCCNINETMFE